MRQNFLRIIAVIVGLSLSSGCAPWHAYSNKVEPVDLGKYKSFYVVKNKDDTSGLDRVINDTFTSLGFESTSGAGDAIPDGVDAIVSYEFQWFWDITNYLLMLKILVREADTQWPIAMGESVRPSLARKAPRKMALEILAPIFNPDALQQQLTAR